MILNGTFMVTSMFINSDIHVKAATRIATKKELRLSIVVATFIFLSAKVSPARYDLA